MKKVINRFSLIAVAFLISFSTVAAQHMQHSQQDTTKQKMKHQMMADSTQMHHQMMNDTTKMNHKNMMHHKMKAKKAKGATTAMHADIWNAYCPVKGGEVDPEAPTVKYKGKTIGFCCPGCDNKFMAEPEKYMKNLSEDGKKFIGDK